MLERVIDLRSDTVTRPSAAMRAAMERAPVGDDVYGEDPTVRELEALAAKITGMEAALFVPSGTMANVVAQLVYVTPGSEIVLGEGCHCMRYEAGAGAALAGSQYRVVPGRGVFTAADVEARLFDGDVHRPGTCLVWVENTHNLSGGRIFPREDLAEISELCRERHIPVHLDGARIFNAAVALDARPRDLVAGMDSLSFCLSKGLGAPVGSLLCGSAEFRDLALHARQKLGGAMRQAGIIAAGGIYALQNNIDRLAADHANAQRLARGLARVSGLGVDVEAVETNIVVVHVRGGGAEELASACRAEGVLFHALDDRTARLVTHLDLTDDDVDTAVQVIGQIRAERHTMPGPPP